VAGVVGLVGCAGRGPHYAPVAPAAVEKSDSQGVRRGYDFDANGSCDYWEYLSQSGRVTRLGFGDAQAADGVETAAYPPDADSRHLLIILDSVPYEIVRQMWEGGRFRLFGPPRRVISPFPAMTDPCLCEFFGISPCPGVESALVREGEAVSPLWTYITERNMPWIARIDYRLAPFLHGSAYLDPDAWFDHELGKIERRFFRNTDNELYSGYVVSTSALGSQRGRNGHQSGLIRLDRFCRSVVRRTRGRVQITLMSDHGHRLGPSRRLPLAEELRRAGWRVGNSLRGPTDVIVPEFGLVSCVALYTASPGRLARDVVGFAGVDFVAYRDGDRVLVVNRSGVATIERCGTGQLAGRPNGYRYVDDGSDPLQLRPILAAMSEEEGRPAESSGHARAFGSGMPRGGRVFWPRTGVRGSVGESYGPARTPTLPFVEDRALFEATVDHVYPDPLHRLWRAFDGMFENPPDLLVSLEDGWHAGSASMDEVIEMSGVHGNLRAAGSTAFVMTTAGELPEVQRMEDLAENLRGLGVLLRPCSKSAGH
jgi:hypothetical protein